MGDQKWSVTGSFAKYVTAISNSIADSGSAGGNPQQYRWFYQGPDINANAAGPLTNTHDALVQLFNWFNANGAQNRRPFADAPSVPGVQTQIRGSLASPNVLEYATGVSRQFGAKAALRADWVYRDYKDFYTAQTDTGTGRVTDSLGQSYDLTLIVNSNLPKRQYQALNTQGTYRFNARTDVGGTYTLSHASGNFEGENVGSGPITAAYMQYPEYKQEAWNFPEGDLQIDQRHRARLWVDYGLPKIESLSVSVLQTLESGTPYGASNFNNTSSNGVDPRLYVTNTFGYLTPPTGATTTYFYTARDAFRLEGQKRTDLGINFNYGLGSGPRKVDLFMQAQIVNIFGQEQLCGCGGTVFQNGGAVTQTRVDQTVRSSVSHPALYTSFNPFTTKPVQGVNWDYAPIVNPTGQLITSGFGQALNRFAYTTPRQFRVGFGVRF